MRFYFAWVDKTKSTFGPEHQVEDEEIFALSISHAEGDVAALEIDIVNPRVGLLTPSRKQWAWLSVEHPGGVTALYFGRLYGIPQALQASLIRLHFVAMPADYQAQKAALADQLRVSPWWDPIWFSEGERDNPDRVLEGRSAVWHSDRVTHEVTISDVITGEDGTELFGADDVFYKFVALHGISPARKAIVEGSVTWEQRGSGTIDVTNELIKAFRARTPPTVITVDDQPRLTEGLVVLAAGEEMLRNWPEKGDGIGGGWSVGASNIGVAGLEPTNITLNVESDWALLVQEVAQGDPVTQVTWGRTPGLAAVVEPRPPDLSLITFGLFLPERTVLWVPVWRMAAFMECDWEVGRQRTETIAFEVSADVQPLLSEPDDEEVIYINAGQAGVDEPEYGLTEREAVIGDLRRPSYFKTDRGQLSLEHLMARARAALLYRARAVDVTFQIPFLSGIDLSCRKGATIVDPRLPGGQATGKIKSYTLSLDGDSGAAIATIVIGCTVGRDGEVVVVEGDPTYAEAGYVATGYQIYDGQVHVPFSGDLGYADFTDQAIDDDGVDLTNINVENSVLSLTVTGGLITEQEVVGEEVEHADIPQTDGYTFRTRRSGPYDYSPVQIIDRISSVKTEVRLELRPVSGGPFDTQLLPDVSELKVPKTIDLETA